MEYHLKPLGKTCAATGEPLEPGSRVISVVVDNNGQLERIDYSEKAWNGPPEGTLGQWQCTVPQPEQKRTNVLDPDALLGYFEQLVEDANPASERLRYVVALFLLQKRRLKLDGSIIREGREYLEFSGTRGEGPYEVANQELSEDEINTVQSEMNRLVDQEWNAA